MKPIIKLTTVGMLSLALVACGKSEAPTVAGTEVTPSAETRIAEGLQAMSIDELREALKKASDANRLYAPAGDNVYEYLLALRAKSPGDVGISSQLIDATPMLVAATDQAIKSDDDAEVERLLGLLRLADPNNPSIATMMQHREERKAMLAREQAAAAQEQQRNAAAQEQQRKAAEKAAEIKVESQKQAAAASAATPAAPAARTAEPVTTAPKPPQPKEPEEDDPASQANRELDLRPISTPEPAYPREALRNSTSGEVTVEITVGRDGSVIAARVVRSTPRGVFDSAALDTVKRWRYGAVSSPITVRKTFAFAPGN